ncbi:unnamed protein product [Lampetra planeri]
MLDPLPDEGHQPVAVGRLSGPPPPPVQKSPSGGRPLGRVPSARLPLCVVVVMRRRLLLQQQQRASCFEQPSRVLSKPNFC